MNLIRLIFLFLTFTIIFSCKKNKNNPAEKIKKDTVKSVAKSINTKNEEVKISEDIFPKFGKQISDFVIEKYSLLTESVGDLNQDGLKDVALVLLNKKDSLESRPLLILLRQKNKSFVLDKISYNAIPQQYTEDGYKIYESQDVEITKGILTIANVGTGGPSGNLHSNFKYLGTNFLLTYIETYNVGAGAWQSLYYDVLEGKLTEEITNTMEENMPVEKKTIKMKKQKYSFEKASPDDIIAKTYQEVENQIQGL